MKYLKKHPYFLGLFVLFFCLHGYVENVGAIQIYDIGKVAFSITIFIGFIFSIFYFFKKNILFASLATLFLAIWFFFFGALHDFIKAHSWLLFLSSYTVLLPTLFIATVVWLFVLKKQYVNHQKLMLFFNMLFIGYMLVDIVSLIYSNKPTLQHSHNIPISQTNITHKPNIYFIICDGYPGQKSLQDSFNFNNEAFINFLEKKSFTIINTTANYNLTTFSMSSLLNMGYVQKDYNANLVTQKIHQVRHKEINNATLFTILENMGYKIHNNSLFDIRNISSQASDNSFILGNSMLLTDKIFINRLNKDIGGALPYFIQKNIPFIRDQSPKAHQMYNAKALLNLKNNLNDKNTAVPTFSYTHFIMPHGPYYYDSLGVENDYKEITAPLAWMDKNKFISYLKYTNLAMQNVIEQIRARQPEANIIFMSDHGFREYNNNNYTYQQAHFNNFCAIYSPTHFSQYQNKTITNVNFFRLFLNTTFKQAIPFIADSTFNVVN